MNCHQLVELIVQVMEDIKATGLIECCLMFDHILIWALESIPLGTIRKKALRQADVEYR
jgi:hypothetical protein